MDEEENERQLDPIELSMPTDTVDKILTTVFFILSTHVNKGKKNLSFILA